MRSAVAAATGECVTRIPAAPLSLHARAQQLEHLGGAVRVQVAGRLVGEHEPRTVDERARDRDALQLAARQLARTARRAVPEADRAQHLRHARFAAAVERAVQGERQRDVLCDVEVRQDVKGLEDEPHPAPAQLGERIVVEPRELDPVERDRAGVRAIEPGHEVEKRRLADPGFAAHRNVLARGELEIDVREDGAGAGAGVGLGEAADGEHGPRVKENGRRFCLRPLKCLLGFVRTEARSEGAGPPVHSSSQRDWFALYLSRTSVRAVLSARRRAEAGRSGALSAPRGAGGGLGLRVVRLRVRAGASRRRAAREDECDHGSDPQVATRHRITSFLQKPAHAVPAG